MSAYQRYYFENFSTIMEQYGFLTFLLPFLLIFSIVFLLLEVTALFKRDDEDVIGRRVHILLSMGFALTALGNRVVIAWMSALIPQATIWLLAIFLLILVLGLVFRGDIKISSWFRGALALIVISSIIVIAANIVTGRAELSANFIDYSLLSSFSAVIIIFAIILAIAVWLSSGDSSSKSEG